MNCRTIALRSAVLFILVICGLAACNREAPSGSTAAPTALSQVPAVRLNFRYESDVPGPGNQTPVGNIEDRNASIQSDFDQNRPEEILDRTLTSPDKKRIAAVYHRTSDVGSEFRLDMYAPDGKLLRKITPDTIAVHFPDTIVWAPNSSSVAFVAMIRAGQEEGNTPPPAPEIAPPQPVVPENTNSNDQTLPSV